MTALALPRPPSPPVHSLSRADGGLGGELHGESGALLRLSPLPSDPEFYFNHFDHPDGITELFNAIPES